MKKDSSDYINSEIFLQLGDNELLHLIIFFSKNFNLAKYNYKIYNKKLSAIIRCFEQQKLELERTRVLVKVIIDQKNLEYFITTKKLIRYQACQIRFLSKFKFIIFYISYKINQKADLLTNY